jgi:hypothetical protein
MKIGLAYYPGLPPVFFSGYMDEVSVKFITRRYTVRVLRRFVSSEALQMDGQGDFNPPPTF